MREAVNQKLLLCDEANSARLVMANSAPLPGLPALRLPVDRRSPAESPIRWRPRRRRRPNWKRAQVGIVLVPCEAVATFRGTRVARCLGEIREFLNFLIHSFGLGQRRRVLRTKRSHKRQSDQDAGPHRFEVIIRGRSTGAGRYCLVRCGGRWVLS